MGKVNVNPAQWEDFLVAFLLDKMLHMDTIVPSNEDFNKLMENLKGKGMKSILLKYYLSMDPQIRLYYKRVKPSLELEGRGNSVVNIMPFLGREEEEEKGGIIRRALRKLLRRESITQEEENLLTEELLNEEE